MDPSETNSDRQEQVLPTTGPSPHQSAAEPINAGFFTRYLALLAYEILTSELLNWLWKRPLHGVVYGPGFVIKSGSLTTLAEAHMMRFVAAHTSIPVPRVYCAFAHRGRTYIVMSKIDGADAARDWVWRSDESRASILRQLRDMVGQLRSVEPPAADKGRVSNIVGGPIFDPRLPKSLGGPFRSIDAFHAQLRDNIPLDAEISDEHADLRELLAFYKQASTDDSTTLTHGDLSSLNVMVKSDKIVGIIDWETAGWYPSYWEYTCAWNVNPYNEFWQCEVDKFLTPRPHELKMEAIRRKYFGDF